MKKFTILLISSIVILVGLLSGCQGLSDLTGGQTGASSGELCLVGVIIVGILVVVLFVGLAGAGTKKNIVVQSPSHNAPQPPVVVKQEPKEKSKSERRCPECGRVIPDDAKMCPYCGKKFKSHFEEEKEGEEPKAEKEEEEKTKQQLKEKTKPPKHCPECGYKFEEEDLDFCPKCGIKLK